MSDLLIERQADLGTWLALVTLAGVTLTGWRRRFRPVRRVATLALVAWLALLWTAAAAAQSAIEYYHTDALGSVRAVTKQVNGEWQVVARYDYRPFGELISPPSPPNEKRLFTGKERDFETGLDYFGARFYRPDLGRFTTVDPGNASAVLHDPQSWHAYAYGRNNPLRFIDFDGRTYQVCAVGSGCSFLSDAGWESAMGKAGGNYLFQNGYMWALVNGSWSFAGSYEHISDDLPPISFDMMIHMTGVVARARLEAYVSEMAKDAALTALTFGTAKAISFGAVGASPFLNKISNQKLRNAIEAIFQATDELAGGTAGAIRTERWTGLPVGGTYHMTKGIERARQLERILSQEPLTPVERAIAKDVLDNLRRAIGGK